MQRANPAERHRMASNGMAAQQDTVATARPRKVSGKPRDTSVKVGATRLKSSNTYETQIYGVRLNGRRGPIKQTYGKSVDEARAKAVTWVAENAGSQGIALPTPPPKVLPAG